MEKYLSFRKGEYSLLWDIQVRLKWNLIYSCKIRDKGNFGGDTQKRSDVEQGSEIGVLWP